MKLANDISYKKYTIQMIVNPATFYVIECGKGAQNETKLNISQRDVKTFSDVQKISVGQIVAVKYENRFCRGFITDIYNRCLKPVYYVWLVDNGSNIEISADSVYMIKTSELRNKKLNAYEVILYGVQPAILDLLISSVNLEENTEKNNLKGILRKRKTDTWSRASFNFVKDLFKSNKFVYVKCFDINGSKITGDIYYKEEGDGKLTSLAQILCDKNFAVFTKLRANVPVLDDYSDGKYSSSTERKIPSVNKNEEWEELSIKNFQQSVARNNFDSGNLPSCSGFDKSSWLNSEKFLNDSKDQASPLGTSNFSPSWILKKMNAYSPSASSESFKSSCQNLEQSERTVLNFKVSLLRIVQRNIKLYDKHK